MEGSRAAEVKKGGKLSRGRKSAAVASKTKRTWEKASSRKKADCVKRKKEKRPPWQSDDSKERPDKIFKMDEKRRSDEARGVDREAARFA